MYTLIIESRISGDPEATRETGREPVPEPANHPYSASGKLGIFPHLLIIFFYFSCIIHRTRTALQMKYRIILKKENADCCCCWVCSQQSRSLTANCDGRNSSTAVQQYPVLYKSGRSGWSIRHLSSLPKELRILPR